MKMPLLARSRGVTLLELMIVIVILGIVVGIAVPSYRNFVLRSNRTDATAMLLKVRAAQEKFFTQRDRYATAAQLTAVPPAGLGYPLGSGPGVARTEHGHFEVQSGVDPAAPPGQLSFLLTATATAGQLRDDNCRRFTINDRGDRQAFNTGGTNTTATCWR